MTDTQRKAKAKVDLILDSTAPAHEQIGELEALAGNTGDPDELVQCFRCTLTHQRKLWEANHRTCPFCGRTEI